MEHLEIDEIIEFVSAKKISEESVNLAAKVNGHIRHCSRCLETVRSFQMIYDEFNRSNTKDSFTEFVNSKETTKKEEDLQDSIENFDGYR